MHRGPTAIIVALVLGHEGLARADDEELAALLEENVVAGPSQTAERAKDAPATTSTIPGDDLRRYGIRSLAEALDFLSLGLVTQDPLHTVEVGSRGVLLTGDYNNHLLLMIDGHYVNEPWGSSAFVDAGLGVPIELIDRVEIMLGPGSVVYGGNAMLAVVNVITRGASTFGGVRVVAEGTISPGQARGNIDSLAARDLGASYRIGAGAGAETSLLGRKLEVTAQIERYQVGQPTFVYDRSSATNADGTPRDFGPNALAPGVWGGPLRRANKATVTSGYARVLVDDLTLTFRGSDYARDTPTPSFNQSFGNFDDPRSGEVDRWLQLGASWSKQLTPRLKLATSGWLGSYHYEQSIHTVNGSDCGVPLTGPCRYDYDGHAVWGGASGNVTYDWLGSDRLTTTAGVLAQGRRLGTDTQVIETASGRPVPVDGDSHATEMARGAFVQQRWSPASFAHLNGGLRFDDAPRGRGQLSPRAAAALDAWRGGTVKAIWSQAFRPATFYEAYGTSVSLQPQGELAPEHERSAELTVEQRAGRHRVFFGVFRTWWDDMIGFRCDAATGVCHYANTGRVDSWGFNARAEGSMGPVQYGLQVTGARAWQTEEGSQSSLPVAPQLYGNARLAWDLGGNRPTIAVVGQLVGTRLADRALDGGWATTPVAPVNVRAKLTASGPVPGLSGLSYRVGIDVASASRTAYVAGPYGVGSGSGGQLPAAALVPVNRFTLLTGLQYAF